MMRFKIKKNFRKNKEKKKKKESKKSLLLVQWG